MRRTVWLLLSCLVVVALVMTSCKPAPVEEKGKEEATTGKAIEKEAPVKPKEEAKPAVPEKEMVLNAFGKLVEKPRYGGVLTAAYEVGPRMGWDPIRYGADATFVRGVCENLITFDWAKGPEGSNEWTGAIGFTPIEYQRPFLSESWEVSKDLLTYTFKIRKGIHFQNKPPANGRELTAEDVKYCFDRQLGTGSGFTQPAPMRRLGDGSDVESITCPDKYTIVFKFTQPGIFRIYAWAEVWEVIYPREIVDKYGNLEDWRNLCGTGPYMLTDYVLDSSATYKKNPDYWCHNELLPDDRLPYIDQVNILIIPDRSTWLSAFRVGKVDMGVALTMRERDDIEKTNPGITYGKYLTPSGTVLTMRLDTEPFNDLRVRKALQMALDLDALMQLVPGERADRISRPNSWPYGPKVHVPFDQLSQDIQDNYQYNPEKAKQLLTEAGYPNGFKVEIVCTNAFVDELSVVKSYWQRIGIQAELKVMELGAYSQSWMDRAWKQMFATLLGAGGQPGWNLVFISPYGRNPCYDEQYYQMYDEMSATVDYDERCRLTKEVEHYALRNLFFISLPPGSFGYLPHQPWVKGHQGLARTGHYNFLFKYARIWIDRDLKYQLLGKRD